MCSAASRTLLILDITADQQSILREVYKQNDIHHIPQMWAMYKEVMGYFANGVSPESPPVPSLR